MRASCKVWQACRGVLRGCNKVALVDSAGFRSHRNTALFDFICDQSFPSSSSVKPDSAKAVDVAALTSDPLFLPFADPLFVVLQDTTLRCKTSKKLAHSSNPGSTQGIKAPVRFLTYRRHPEGQQQGGFCSRSQLVTACTMTC